MKKLIFVIIFLLTIGAGFVFAEENITRSTIFGTNAVYSDEDISIGFYILPYLIIPMENNDTNNILLSLQMAVNSENKFVATPNANFSLYRNIVFFGTSFPVGFEIEESSIDDGSDFNFIASQQFWIDIGNDWKYFSTNARANYLFDYANRPEQSTTLSYNAYLNFRGSEHRSPYPWTISIGPEFEWLYTFNDKNNYYRDQIFLGGRAEFRGMKQGDNDDFPRSWNPIFAVTFLNQWDRQDYEENSFDWVWEPGLVVEFGLSPRDNFDFMFFAEIPLDEIEHEIYAQNEFSVGLNVRFHLDN